jgi:hypothetical protein
MHHWWEKTELLKTWHVYILEIDMDKTLTKSTITLIATIVVACFSAMVVVIGFIGRNSFAPKIVDEIFGLSTYVLAEITKRVDSGYSGTFIFAPKSPDKNAQLLFFAEKGQSVKVTINGNSLGSKRSKFRVFIDNTPWGDSRELPFNLVHGDVTDKLKFDVEPGGNIHVLRFVPNPLEEDALILIECLVLVYNK